MVGGAIGFASTTAFPAVAKTERERSRAMSLRGDAIRQAGANKVARPYRIRNAKFESLFIFLGGIRINRPPPFSHFV